MPNDQTGVKQIMMNSEGYLLHNRKMHLRIFNLDDWAQLTDGDIVKLIRLSWHLNSDNALGYKKKIWRPYNVQQMADALGLSLNRMYDFKKRLTDAAIMKQLHGQFYLNPLYVMRGKRVSVLLYTLFEAELARCLTDNAKRQFQWLQEGGDL